MLCDQWTIVGDDVAYPVALAHSICKQLTSYFLKQKFIRVLYLLSDTSGLQLFPKAEATRKGAANKKTIAVD
jgi:hypothetical protein